MSKNLLEQVGPVYENSNRNNAIKNAVQKNFEVAILDDGFQQLGIHKNVDILLLNASKPFSELNLLPMGFARETRKQIHRAHLLVLTKSDEFNFPDWVYQLSFNKNIFATMYEYEIWEYSDQGYLQVEDIPKPIFAFCGIGDPNSFEIGLSKMDINPVKFKAFKDHEPYSAKTIEVFTIRKRVPDCGREPEWRHLYSAKEEHKLLPTGDYCCCNMPVDGNNRSELLLKVNT